MLHLKFYEKERNGMTRQSQGYLLKYALREVKKEGCIVDSRIDGPMGELLIHVNE
mgnify:CR=1 FL=1